MSMTPHEQSMAPSQTCATITEVLRYWAARQPEKLLYRWLGDGGQEETLWTFADVDAKARAIAVALQRVAQPGDRALLLYAPSIDYVAAFIGCLYAGVIAVPAYLPDPTRLEQSLPRLLAIVDDCKPALLLSTEMLLQFGAALWGSHPSFEGVDQVATDTVDDGLADAWHMPSISGESLAFLQYTSGSTGLPKGVMVSHANLMSNSYACHAVAQHTVDDVYMSWLPGYHDFGLIGGILQPLTGGFTGNLMSPISFLKKPFRWLEAISKYRAVTSPFPNFSLDLCVRKVTAEERATLDLSSWRIACNGAEPVRRETLERFAALFAPCGFNAQAFLPGYGLAEATLGVAGIRHNAAVTYLEVDSDALLRDAVVPVATAGENTQTFVGCGAAIPGTTICIVDPATTEAVDAERVGEIWVQSPSVCRGYWNKPELSEETFRATLASGEGPWLRTGDLGFFHDGELFIAGRMKDLIILQGKNHYPQDLERTAEGASPALRAGCLAAFSVEQHNEERVVLVAEVDPRAGAIDAEAVKKAVRQAIAQAHGVALHDLVLLRANTIHKTSSGKIQRHASKKRYLAQELDLFEPAATNG
jgi:acyl-CoA synthetase (AMP-forming)/AMP-acid ligase II